MPRLYTRADNTAQHIMDRVREHFVDWLDGRALRATDLRDEIKHLIVEMLDEERLDAFDETRPFDDDE